MSTVIENSYGVISIEDNIIARLAVSAAMECDGIAGMASRNVKDNFVKLLKGSNVLKGVKIISDSKTLAINLHIVVNYGADISKLADDIIEAVKNRVQEFTGLIVDNADVFVEGVKTDK